MISITYKPKSNANIFGLRFILNIFDNFLYCRLIIRGINYLSLVKIWRHRSSCITTKYNIYHSCGSFALCSSRSFCCIFFFHLFCLLVSCFIYYFFRCFCFSFLRSCFSFFWSGLFRWIFFWRIFCFCSFFNRRSLLRSWFFSLFDCLFSRWCFFVYFFINFFIFIWIYNLPALRAID